MNAEDSRKVKINLALNRPVTSFSSLGDLPQGSDKSGKDRDIVEAATRPYAEALLTVGQHGEAAKFLSSRAFAAFSDHRLYPEWIGVYCFTSVLLASQTRGGGSTNP